jgi:hypothetical protein
VQINRIAICQPLARDPIKESVALAVLGHVRSGDGGFQPFELGGIYPTAPRERAVLALNVLDRWFRGERIALHLAVQS